MANTQLIIVYTNDTFLTIYQPLAPWLALRQSNRSRIRIGHIIAFELVYGPPFQERPIYGRIDSISHFTQGFIIVTVAMDPGAFASSIHLAIPRSWFALSLISSIIYRRSFRSLPTPRFTQYLDPSHPVYRRTCLQESPRGSRLCPRSR
jgi:hypothetical protein